jgi:hypothetical protein
MRSKCVGGSANYGREIRPSSSTTPVSPASGKCYRGKERKRDVNLVPSVALPSQLQLADQAAAQHPEPNNEAKENAHV